jgi:hypothetical protein
MLATRREVMGALVAAAIARGERTPAVTRYVRFRRD